MTADEQISNQQPANGWVSTFWDAKKTAEALNLSTQTLAKWRCNKSCDLRYYKIGRWVRYNPADVRAFVETRAIGA